MEIELKEVRDFIKTIPPFDQLPEQVVDEVTQKLTIQYLRDGKTLPVEGDDKTQLYIIRKGLISLYSSDSRLMGQLGEGDTCTMFCVQAPLEEFSATAEEDTLVYAIPCIELTDIVKDYPGIVISYIQNSAAQRLKNAVSSLHEQSGGTSSLLYTSVLDIMSSPVLTIDIACSISEAARKMTERRISCVMIEKDAKIVGILTIKDIAKRCVAAELSPQSPVEKIMSSKMITIERDTFAYDALMIMTRESIRHLPVMENDELLGMVTAGDLIRQEGRNSAYLTGAIKKAQTIETLVESSNAIPQLQLQLVNMGATADHVGKGVTAITSAITRRLVDMAIDKLGPAPVPFAWVAAGSQARREQTSHTDQDNGLILHNDVSDSDLPYFEALAKFVSDGLAECGYIYCPGNVMATNPQWRQTQKVWAAYFDDWMSAPKPDALLLSSIFFDLRAIYGDKSLLDEIRTQMLETSQKSTLFLAHLTANALKLRPPLGIIRDFVLIHDGEHNDTLDLKHNGIVPIVDLARIYALAEGIAPVNTTERLELAAGTKSLSREGSANLLDAFEFIGSLRIQHQARQIRNGKKPDNYMSPKSLSRLEREHLKDAFKVIQTMQSAIERSFRAGGLG
ncbi:MAG: cyclic nucleotide-binding/CBS domain-containing protein [Gammaproteobacteria bacterium]|nr:cyclic nucleotide-binding/CBS domain-containing protein [Gammaproteobacteria bacterium]